MAHLLTLRGIRTLLIALSMVVAGSFILAAPVHAIDPLEKKLGCGSNISLDTGTDCGVGGGTNRVENTIKRILNVISIIVGVVAVVMIIVGGFRYVVSGGDANATKSARDTVIYAVIGLIIVAIAQAIVQFVLSDTTKGF